LVPLPEWQQAKLGHRSLFTPIFLPQAAKPMTVEESPFLRDFFSTLFLFLSPFPYLAGALEVLSFPGNVRIFGSPNSFLPLSPKLVISTISLSPAPFSPPFRKKHRLSFLSHSLRLGKDKSKPPMAKDLPPPLSPGSHTLSQLTSFSSFPFLPPGN